MAGSVFVQLTVEEAKSRRQMLARKATEWIARNALVRIVERYEHRPEVHRPDGCKIAAKALADIFEEDLFEVSLVEAKRVFCLMAQVPVNQFGECTMIVDPATGEQSYSRSLPAPEW